MTMFGDDEPEDAWDANDDAWDMAANLIARLDVLDDSTMGDDLDAIIDRIESRLGHYRSIRMTLSDRDRLRVNQLSEDLPTLRERARG